MRNATNNPYTRHEQIILLLPWYVNATLEESERQSVEQHLKVCLLCKREVANLQNLAAVVKQPNHLDSAAQTSFLQLKKRLHVPEPAEPQPAIHVVTQPPRQPWYEHLSIPSLALAAALALALVLPDRTPTQLPITSDYRTLSNSEIAANPNHGMKVIFKEHTSKATIAQILNAVQGSIVQGPDQQASYQISFDKTVAPTDILERVARIRTNSHVLFAEPAYALLSAPTAGK